MKIVVLGADGLIPCALCLMCSEIPPTRSSSRFGRTAGYRASLTRATATSRSSCSQILTTRQPAALSRRSVSRSLRRLVSIFASHHAAFALGDVPCIGQPCQKQPSTNTATLALAKTTSARLREPTIGARAQLMVDFMATRMLRRYGALYDKRVAEMLQEGARTSV